MKPVALVATVLIAMLLFSGRGKLLQAGRAQALGLPQGWNLIAYPGGTIAGGTVLTYQAGDTGYEVTPAGSPLVAGLGYWVYSPSRSALPLSGGAPTATIIAPAGQFVMVGDPSGASPADVSGADILVGFDPVNGYQPIYNNVLAPGQGAFAMSVAGGRIVLQAQSGAATDCSTLETGSACPVSGACPQSYPVAITSDALAHPAIAPGDAAVAGTIALCFNDISQAQTAGYQLAPATRITLQGPASATTSNMRFTVLSAMLESPEAFHARVTASGDKLCAGCDISGATGIVTVQYGVENLNRPPTLISTGSFVSAHSPQDFSGSYLLLASQHAVDHIHDGSPIVGTVSGVFGQARFTDIDTVNWRLDNPLLDVSNGIPQPHGPSLLFELDFRGPQAGQVIAYGGGSAPLPAYNPVSAIPPVVGPVAGAATPKPSPPVPTITPPAAIVPTPVIPAVTPGASAGTNPNSTYSR